MQLLIKILGQTKQFPALHVDFGPGYSFPWNEAQKAYTYAPKAQKEIDDIFQSQSVHGVWFFAPVLVESAPAADAAPAAPVAANPDAEAEITRLSGLLRASETLIAKLRAETADRDETITMLRADLDAQRTKAAQIPATAAGPAKAKPGRKPQPIPVETDDDLPTP